MRKCESRLRPGRDGAAWRCGESICRKGGYELSVQSSLRRAGQKPSADMADWSGPELLEAYARRQASPVEVMKAVIARIEAYEPRLQALYAYEPQAALRSARES